MSFNPLDVPLAFVPPRHLAASAWIQHTPFAMALVAMLEPATLVELGTYTGVSYCAFCQGVQALQLETRCVAIDTWTGDPHAGFYGRDVLDTLRAYHDPLYGTFSTLIQSTFDEAAARIPDGSIDLLHIDGFHTYDAVQHDFHRWFPKMSARGVVLLHDTAERAEGFGVWQLWNELAAQYRHFAFAHGHGLGVLAVGAQTPPALDALLDASKAERETIGALFHRLGLAVEYERELAHREDLAHESTSTN